MKQYKLTLLGLVVSLGTLLFSVILNLDLFESFIGYLNAMEAYELDEIIIPFFIFGLFAFFDALKRRKEYSIEREKLKIYKAMLSSSHHILNNFLNQMQIFQITAEDTPGFDPDVLKRFNRIMKNTSEQIAELGAITIVDEKSIYRSVAPGSGS